MSRARQAGRPIKWTEGWLRSPVGYQCALSVHSRQLQNASAGVGVARTRPGLRKAEPQPGSGPQDTGLPFQGPGPGPGATKEKMATTLVPFPPRPMPPLQAACPHQSVLPACPALSFPYIEFCSRSGKEAHPVPGGKKGPVPRDTSS